MNAYHDMRSVRSWLNQMYPNVPILVQRNAQKTKKSFFFLQDAREKFEDQGSAFFSTNRTIHMHLVTEGPSIKNPGSTDAFWKTTQVLNFLRDRLLRERVIPQFLYNNAWMPPYAYRKLGAGIAPGTYELAVASVDRYDKESLLSSPVTATVLAGDKLMLSIPNWPLGHPLNKQLVVYYRTGPTAAWKAIKVLNTILSDLGATQTEITSVAPLGPVRNPVTTSKQYMGHLKVDTASVTMMESMQVDDAFHGFCAVTFRSRAPQFYTAQVPVQTVNVAPTITF